jgi:hypothetical protein
MKTETLSILDMRPGKRSFLREKKATENKSPT